MKHPWVLDQDITNVPTRESLLRLRDTGLPPPSVWNRLRKPLL